MLSQRKQGAEIRELSDLCSLLSDLSLDPLLSQPAFGVQGSLTTAARRRDSLTIMAIRHISRGKDPLDAGICRVRTRPFHITVRLQGELPLQKADVGRVADAEKHATALDDLALWAFRILQGDSGHAVVVIAQHLLHHAI